MKKIRYLICFFGIAGLATAEIEKTSSHAVPGQHFLWGKMRDGAHIGMVNSFDADGTSFAWGIQGIYDHNRWFSLEMAFTHSSDTVDIQTPGFLDLQNDATMELDVNIISLTARYNFFTEAFLNLYLGGGIGYAIIQEELKASELNRPDSVYFYDADASNSFTSHGVLGAEILLTEHWEIFAEGRYNVVDTELLVDIARRQNGTSALGNQNLAAGLDYDHMLFKLGFNYHF